MLVDRSGLGRCCLPRLARPALWSGRLEFSPGRLWNDAGSPLTTGVGVRWGCGGGLNFLESLSPDVLPVERLSMVSCC